MQCYTASVIGGGMGGKLSMDALVASPRFELVAAADLREDVRKELAARYPDVRLFPDHQTLLANCSTDVVCVSTFPPSHRQVALDALRMELKGMLCEKPLGDTAAAGRDILQAVKAKRLPLAVPHGLLKLRHADEIRARVAAGEIGTLELVEIQCDKWDIINAGIHWLNYFVNLVPDDSMTWVMAATESSTRTYRDGMQVETTGITYVQTKKGVRLVMHTGDYVTIQRQDKPFLYRLVGTGGTIEFYAWESVYRLLNAAHPRGETFRPTPYPESPHQRHLEAMIDQAESGCADYRIAESSLAALELVEAAYLSARCGCKVELPLEQFATPPPLDWAPGQPYVGGGGRDGRALP